MTTMTTTILPDVEVVELDNGFKALLVERGPLPVVASVLAALLVIADALRAGEISDDEFARAVTPSLEGLSQNATSNSYWLSLISQAQTRPDLMARNRLDAIEASVRTVTKGDVIAAAKAWLSPEDARIARVVPAAAD